MAARPRPSDARRGRSRGSSACSGGSANATRSCWSSRTSTSPMPRPGRWSRSSPGSRATSGWPSSARHQPDVVARDDSWTTDLEAILTGSRPERLALPPLDRDELAALIEGIEGERASASLLLLVAERSGGLPLVAEELLAARRELPSASLTGLVRRAGDRPDGRPLGGMPARAAAAGSRRAPADARASSRRSRPRSRSTRAGPRRARSPGPRVGTGVLDADLWAGRTEALANGFLVEHDDAVGFRHDSIGKAVAWDLLPIARTRYHAALATSLGGPPSAVAAHWLARVRSVLGAGGRDRGGRGRRCPPCRRRRAGCARAGAVAPGATARPDAASRRRAAARPGPGRPPGARLRGRLRGRPDVARDGLPRVGDRRSRRAARPRPAGPAPRAAGARPAGGRRPGRRDARRPARRRAGPARAEPGTGDRRGRTRPAQDARRHLLRGAAAGSRGDEGRPRLRPGGALAGGPRADDAGGRDGLGERPGGLGRAPARGGGGGPRARRP